MPYKTLQQQNDPSYLNYSQRTRGDTSFGSLFEDMGKIGGMAITGIDEEIKRSAQEATTAATTDLNASLFAKPGAKQPSQTVASGDTVVDEFGSEQTSATGSPDISAGLSRAKQLKTALAQKAITPTQYWGEVTKVAKTLKAQYPGYTDVIDAQFKTLVGHTPAEGVANAQREAYSSAVAQTNNEEKVYQTYVRQNDKYLPPDYFDRAQSRKPYTKAEVYKYVAHKKANEHDLDRQRTQLAYEKDVGELSEERALRVAHEQSAKFVNSIVSDTSERYQGLREMLQRAAANPTTLSPNDKAQITAEFGRLRAEVELGLEQKVLNASWGPDGKHNFYNSMKDPNKLKQVKDNALRPLEIIQRQIEDGNFGMLNSTLNYTKAVEQGAYKELLDSGPYFRLMGAVRKSGATDKFIDETLLSRDFNSLKTDTMKAVTSEKFLKGLMATEARKAITGETDTSLKKDMADVSNAAGVDPKEKRVAVRLVWNNRVEAVTNPQIADESAIAAAETMFSPENKDFTTNFPYEQRQPIFEKMTSKAVTNRIATLAQKNPDIGRAYKDWSLREFYSLFKADLDTLQEGITNRDNKSYRWNPDKVQFDGVLTEIGEKDKATDKRNEYNPLYWSQKALSYERHLQNKTDRTVDKLNRRLKTLADIITSQGGDPKSEIPEFLMSVGIKQDSGKEYTFWQRLRHQILRSYGADTPDSEPAISGKEAMPQYQ